MNIHIELDRFGREDIFWIADDHTGRAAYIPAHDPYNLRSIDQAREGLLRRLLETTSEENLEAYAIPAETLARAISLAFVDLQPSFARIFDESPSFCIPTPLRRVLGIDESITTVSEWLDRYPANNT